MDIAILLRLLFAHFLADFILQTDNISNGKNGYYIQNGVEVPITSSVKNGYLCLHGLIHAIISYLFVADWSNWLLPLTLFTTHIAIDWIKIRVAQNSGLTFVLDQLAHLCVIVLLWVFFFTSNNSTYHWLTNQWNSTDIWFILIGYGIILKPTSIFLNLFISRWTPHDSAERSLPNAGKWIGYLERLLIITFMLCGKMEAVGFLLAAKSIFRYGELSKSNDIKMTEYVLIGTLSSFTIAILVGFTLLQIL
ncbi:MAG: DUF3307 domain-containing protein [Marinifilaceae bacterium]